MKVFCPFSMPTMRLRDAKSTCLSRFFVKLKIIVKYDVTTCSNQLAVNLRYYISDNCTNIVLPGITHILGIKLENFTWEFCFLKSLTAVKLSINFSGYTWTFSKFSKIYLDKHLHNLLLFFCKSEKKKRIWLLNFSFKML